LTECTGSWDNDKALDIGREYGWYIDGKEKSFKLFSGVATDDQIAAEAGTASQASDGSTAAAANPTDGSTAAAATPTKVYRECKHAKSSGQTKSGIYTIKPDGGELKVYCDMDGLDGTGWALIGIRSRSKMPEPAAETVTPSDEGKMLPNLEWNKLRKSMLRQQEDWSWAVLNKGQSRGNVAPAVFVPSSKTLFNSKGKECKKPPLFSLNDPVLAHAETSGCTVTGMDYCLFLGVPGKHRTTAMYDHCDTPFGLQTCSSTALGASCSAMPKHGYTEYDTAFVYVQAH